MPRKSKQSTATNQVETDKPAEIKAYKAFNSKLQCTPTGDTPFQYEIGKIYKHNGKVKLCHSGFHACIRPQDVFNYYSFNPENRICEVILRGQMDGTSGGDKICAAEIEIVRELTWHEVLDLVNTGDGNTGDGNTGYGNTGYGNTGYGNTGDGNTGYGNTGHRNTGYGNTGHRNTGYGNTGYGNTGYGNTGDGNTGYGNIISRSSGIFCTEEPTLIIFNRPTHLKWDEIDHPSFYNYDLTEWISAKNMSNEEKAANPSFQTTGGYLKEFTYREMFANGWKKDDDDNKHKFLNLPNFSCEIFKEITGLDVTEDYNRLIKQEEKINE